MLLPNVDKDDISWGSFWIFIFIYCSQYQYTIIPMEKYRRWTDEATGINPFITAKTAPINILQVLFSAVLAVIKLHVVFLLVPGLFFYFFVGKTLGIIPVLGSLVKLPVKLLTCMLGLWTVDDGNFQKWVEKNRGKGGIILSNSLSIIDAFYYMSTLGNVKFLVSSPKQQKFETVSGLSAIMNLLSNKQPFFNLEQSQNSQLFKTLLSKQLANKNNVVIFYEGIKTNGVGTIKISTKLSNQLYSFQKDYCIAHLKYTSAPQGLSSLVSHPLILFFVALGTTSISLKVRSNPISISSQHSGTDVQKDIDSFLQANAAKLLDTEPASYFDFLDFYFKTQTDQYTNDQDNKQKQGFRGQ